MEKHMNVKKIMTVQEMPATELEPITEEQMQNELNYILAEQITRKLLDKGLISSGEYDKIMAENRHSFSPYLADLYPSDSLI